MTSNVSCIIPVYNGERYLSQAIDTAIAQQDCDVEVIVVDDGSTDGTQEVAARYERRVRYVRQANAGPASARNHGARLASCDMLAFLDADDLWAANKTAIQLARFAQQPQIAISTTHMQNFWSEDVDAGTEVADNERLAQSQPNLASSFMTRRALFEEMGGLDESLKHRDLHEFLVRAADRGLIVQTLPEVLVRRRIHSSNMSRSRAGAGDLEMLAIARARIARRRRAEVA